jgi:hypothetical protein
METKIQKEFIDHGFGFPVRLVNVPMVKVRGEWTPNINYNHLAEALLFVLSHSPARLTGHQIRFIRTHFNMTLDKFAKRFCVTHAAVIKWEKTQQEPTAMNWSMEKDIRLFILSKLAVGAKQIAALYQELEALPDKKTAPIRLNAEEFAA